MSFNIGLSGLRAAQMDLSVTGNNIANASTVGFKQSRAEFGDVYNASILGTGKNTIGAGVLVERISQQHTQGNTNYTDRSLDMAINGNGYFMLSSNGQIEYTRAGYFNLDKDGYIINNSNKRLQGYEADLQGNINGVLGDIRLSQVNVEPNATTRMDIELNLDSRKESLDIQQFDPRDRTTYSDSNPTSVFDSLGIEHVITQYFVKVNSTDKNQGNTWAVITSFNGQFYNGDGTPLVDTNGKPLTAESWDDAPANKESLVEATLIFNTRGSLVGHNTGYNNDNDVSGGTAPTENSVPFDITIPQDLLGGAWLGSNGSNEIVYNLRGTTQYGATYSALAQSQDGYTTGRLSGLEVGEDGIIFGRYTNGQNRAVGQVPLVTFRNPEGLRPNGSTGWLETSESGIPTINQADTGITGKVIGGALEDSNVDLAEELVKMIIGQRNYQANAKTIQTQDTITQTIINLR